MPRRLHALLYHNANARVRVVLERANFSFHDARFVRIEARDYQIRTRRDHASRDRRELIRGLALAEYHFGNSAPDAPMIVELGKAKILERQLADLLERRAGSHAARGDTVEDFANSLFGHRRLRSSGRIGCASVN